MDIANKIRLSQHQQIVIAFNIAVPVSKALATIIALFEFMALDHGAHGTVENQNLLFQGIGEIV